MSNQNKIDHATQVVKGGGRILTLLIFLLPWLPSRVWMSIDLIFIAFFFRVMMDLIYFVIAWRDVQEKLVELRSLAAGKFRDDPLIEELKLFLNQADFIVNQTK